MDRRENGQIISAMDLSKIPENFVLTIESLEVTWTEAEDFLSFLFVNNGREKQPVITTT